MALSSPGIACTICFLTFAESEESDPLIHGGCACRGSSSNGYIHFKCLVEQAKAIDTNRQGGNGWQCCLTCHQEYNADIMMKLARTHLNILQNAGYNKDSHNGAMLIEYVNAMNDFGLRCISAKQYLKAKQYFVHTRQIVAKQYRHRRAHVGLPSIAERRAYENAALTYANNLANALFGLKDFEEAEKVAVDALQRYKTSGVPVQLQRVIAIEMLLGNVYLSDERYDQALNVLSELLKKCRKHCGDQHGTTAICVSLVSACYLKMKKYEQALELALEFVQITTQVFGKRHAETKVAEDFLKRLKKKMQDDTNMSRNLIKSIGIMCNMPGRSVRPMSDSESGSDSDSDDGNDEVQNIWILPAVTFVGAFAATIAVFAIASMLLHKK